MDAAWQTCCGSRRGLWRALPALLSLVALLSSLGCPTVSWAQRVQIPTSTAPDWGAPALAPPPSTGIPAPNFNPYAPGAATPVYGAPLGPPPTGSLPYSYAPPAVQSAPAWGAPSAPAYDYAAPPPPAGLSGEGTPLGWQPGSYGYQQADGSTVTWRQFLARLRFEHTLLLGDNTSNAFGMNRTEVASTFAVPIGSSVETPLLITPGFAFNWFDGPESDPAAVPRGPDIPPRAYDAYVDFAMNPRFTPELGAELGFRTGVWTDFSEVNTDSIRLLGRGLGVVSVTPQFEVLAGVVYLDRLRVKLLPAGGVRWRPSPDWDLYLVFPNPKIRRTWFSTGSADWWWYVAGEYGGGSWTVDRAGLGDRIDYNDLRAVFGVEWQTPRQATGHFEIGYAFDRELVFESGEPSRTGVDDAVMFRAGIGF
ncbi:hypothetical protein Pla108_21730 [Botrimarina colliarenosi]|uniref:Uncharacterized protein n=1 Tax=Botrimarina colliarenosi TaxID=2528001 RepID=A0A5C6AFC4_9BACT|nr:hypothetical protein [Botrimarina colliarenosi]TWT98018.1 hypothetical protein Pla108_21730 [Botrimarina colliarenosi]